MVAQPFADAVELYRSAGWPAVLWFPPFAKHPPPTGFTGTNGRTADDEQIRTWLRREPAGNIGLRLPEGVIGIDVDAYDDKRGAETLDQAEQALGPLPATWISTARDDNVSGIRWFRVPIARYLDRIPPANSGIEIIQNHHRYALVWPSVHPDTGATYKWHDPQGLISTTPPTPDQLAELPQDWVAFLLRRDDNGASPPEISPNGDQPATSLAGATSFYDLVEIYAEKIRSGAPRNDTGRDLAIQLRDNGCSKRDALQIWGGVLFQLLGPLANAPGADGEPYEPREWQATVASIYSRAAREPLPGFARGGGAPSTGSNAADAPPDPGRNPGPIVAENDNRVAMTTDLGNSLRFARLFRDQVRYVHGEDRWLIWDGICWAPDKTGRALELTKLVIDQIRQEAEEAGEGDLRDRLIGWAIKSEGLATRRNTLGGAEVEPGIALTPDLVDSDPNLLCVLNGTIDLTTGELREHRPEDLISRVCPVTYDPTVTTSPLLDQFVGTFMPDPQELAYTLKAFGSTLLGGNRDRLLYIVLGHTTSGKSQFMEAVAATLGPYAVPVGTSVFRANQDDKPRPDLIRALPARLAYAEEASHNWELHTDMVKRLTGGSMVVVRGMRSNTMVERIPSFTPLIVTNEMPRIRGADQAVKRRMVVLRFGNSLDPSQEDPTIKQRFVHDERTRQAILTQLVAGCLRSQRESWQNLPANFEWAKQEAFAELNHVNDFLQHMWDEGKLSHNDELPLHRCWKTSDLHLEYAGWVREHGDPEDRRTMLGQRMFTKALRDIGWVSRTSNGTRWEGKFNPQVQQFYPSE